jgi:hypothetical protein
MKILVVGATGATGRLLVEQLLLSGHNVKAIVRSSDKLPEAIRNHDCLTVIQASILNLIDKKMTEIVNDCTAIASCLGHNLNWKGIFGHPRRLVTDATQLLCNAIKANKKKETTKFVLMNTAGNSNRGIHEPLSLLHRFVIMLIRLLIPPQLDNEMAADYLRTVIGQNDKTIEWSVVRPDTLINEDEVSQYEVHPSPTRSAIFNPGKTSRINVGHFMADLITDNDIWDKWKGQMPVIYNKD